MAQPNQQPEPQYFLRSQSTDSTNSVQQQRGLLLTHSSTLPSLSRTTSLNNSNLNFQRRTVEGARQLRDNFHNVIREIQPLVETARAVNISSLLNRGQSEPNIQQPQPEGANPGSNIVIEIDRESPRDEADEANEGQDNQNQDNQQEVQTNPEAIEALQVLQKYVPFVVILLIKCLYDHQEGILNVIVLFAIFVHANSVVKKEATKRARRNLTKLFLAVVYIIVGVFFIHYVFGEEQLYMNLVFVRTYTSPLTVWDLLWFVGITDFVLKLITVMVKILLTMMPGRVVPFQKRGKIYLFIEAVSQLYRGLAPITTWLYYLLESYQGTEKIVGVILAAAYMVSKGADLMSKFKLLKMALFKLIQNVTVGSSPSKEQIQTAGEHCPICHDEYESPVILQCRHIFCESCVTTWFDREQTCPLCRSKIVDDPSWRDGSTTFFIQLF